MLAWQNVSVLAFVGSIAESTKTWIEYHWAAYCMLCVLAYYSMIKFLVLDSRVGLIYLKI